MNARCQVACKRRLILITGVFCLSLFFMNPARADENNVSFDASMLAGGAASGIDVSRFEKPNNFPPGNYNLDVYLNTKWISRMRVRLAPAGPSGKVVPCVSSVMLERMGLERLDKNYRQKAKRGCVTMSALVPDSQMTADLSALTLRVSVPQAFMDAKPRGYTDPASWDPGITAFKLDYSANVYHSHYSGTGSTSSFARFRSGFNSHGWQFRAHSIARKQFDGPNQSDGLQWHNLDAFARRNIADAHAVMTLGDSHTDGTVFNSFALRGFQLSTDERMWPDSLRGYAPIIRGVANSNAKVTISQNGQQIYQTSVPPGPFEIRDLYPTGYGGDLHVTVTEADGSEHEFLVPYASTAKLVRAGMTRYTLGAGVLRRPGWTTHSAVFQAAVQHGFNNFFTGYGGVQFADGYTALLAGSAFNTPYGALSFDATEANTVLPMFGHKEGQSYRLTYSKILPRSGTSLTVAAYRYSTKGFYTLQAAQAARAYEKRFKPFFVNNLPGLLGANGVLQQKGRFTLSLNQYLGPLGGSVYAIVSGTNYWNTGFRQRQYQLGYNSRFRRVSYGVRLSRSQLAPHRHDDRITLDVSLSIGKSRHAPTLSGQYERGSHGEVNKRLLLSGNAGKWNQFSYGASLSRSRMGKQGQGDVNAGVNGTYDAPYATLSATASQGRGYSQESAGANGGLVIHQGGITFGQSSGDTVGLLHAPGASGAHLLDSPNVQVDGNGYALVPYLQPYHVDTVRVDPKGLPLGVKLETTSAHAVPYAGAVVLMNIKSNRQFSLLAHLQLAHGKVVPFGARVYDPTGKMLGIVGQGGLVLLHGLDHSGRFHVDWHDSKGESHECHFTYKLPKKDDRQQQLQQRQSHAVKPVNTHITCYTDKTDNGLSGGGD